MSVTDRARTSWWFSALVLLVVSGSPAAQTDPGAEEWAAFDAAYETAINGNAKQKWQEAVDAFAAVGASAEGWSERVSRGVWAAWGAFDDDRCRAWSEAAFARRAEHLGFVGSIWMFSTERAGGADGLEEAIDLGRRLLDSAAELPEREASDVRKKVLDFLRTRVAKVLEIVSEQLRDEGEEALWAFETLLEAFPDSPVMIGNTALAYRQVGRIERSEELYLRALEAAPQDAILKNDYGLLLKGTGRIDEAMRLFRQSRALDERAGDGPATNNLVQLHRLGRHDAIADPFAGLRRILELRPDNEMARRGLIDRILVGSRFP